MDRLLATSEAAARECATTLGKNANCQTRVSLILARGETPIAVGLLLFLPEAWMGDPDRTVWTGLPEDLRRPRTKAEIALAETDRVRAAGARFGCVLADAGYGCSAPFRQALSARDLTWAVRISRRNKVYPLDGAMVFPVAGRARPRQPHVPDPHSPRADKPDEGRDEVIVAGYETYDPACSGDTLNQAATSTPTGQLTPVPPSPQ